MKKKDVAPRTALPDRVKMVRLINKITNAKLTLYDADKVHIISDRTSSNPDPTGETSSIDEYRIKFTPGTAKSVEEALTGHMDADMKIVLKRYDKVRIFMGTGKMTFTKDGKFNELTVKVS